MTTASVRDEDTTMLLERPGLVVIAINGAERRALRVAFLGMEGSGGTGSGFVHSTVTV